MSIILYKIRKKDKYASLGKDKKEITETPKITI
jgi:hypothetical protein